MIALIIVGTAVNTVTLTNKLTKVSEMLDSFPDNCIDSDRYSIADKTAEYLDNLKGYLYFALPSNTLDDFYAEFSEMTEYCKGDDNSAYRATIKRVKEKLSSLIMHEKFSLTNIF